MKGNERQRGEEKGLYKWQVECLDPDTWEFSIYFVGENIQLRDKAHDLGKNQPSGASISSSIACQGFQSYLS